MTRENAIGRRVRQVGHTGFRIGQVLTEFIERQTQ